MMDIHESLAQKEDENPSPLRGEDRCEGYFRTRNMNTESNPQEGLNTRKTNTILKGSKLIGITSNKQILRIENASL